MAKKEEKRLGDVFDQEISAKPMINVVKKMAGLAFPSGKAKVELAKRRVERAKGRVEDLRARIEAKKQEIAYSKELQELKELEKELDENE